MKRKILLYIDGKRADLNDEALVLYNYAQTEISNPTAVKNSFSKQVTLQGTPANDKIFGGYFRTDRVTGTTGFDALKKTPFSIYADGGDLLESGYLRLDGVTRTSEGIRSYKVTLFGGLGEFFYGLSYDDAGNKKTMASLAYLNAEGDEQEAHELDFVMAKEQVQTAWTRLAGNTTGEVAYKWDVLNFCPAYEGKPTDFEDKKGYGSAITLQLPSQAGHNPDGDGMALLTFPDALDQWAAKDLRSYLQRPVFSIAALLKGVQRFATAHGFAFDYSGIPSSLISRMWVTLPLVPSLTSYRNSSGSFNGVYADKNTTSYIITDITPELTLPDFAGLKVSIDAITSLGWYGDESAPAHLHNVSGDEVSVVFVQLLAYDGDTMVGASNVVVLGPTDYDFSGPQLADDCAYVPQFDNSIIPEFLPVDILGDGAPYSTSKRVELALEEPAPNATRFVLRADAYGIELGSISPISVIGTWPLNGSAPTLWLKDDTEVEIFKTVTAYTYAAGTYTIDNGPRSGATLGKAELLNTAHTPAEYLIGWAKMNGLCFHYNPVTKKVTLMKRDSYYGTGLDAVNLNDRMDTSKGIDITPMLASSRWYALSLPVVEGSYAKQYKEAFGLDYGIQKVDTGYPFDASTKALLDSVPYKTAACVLDNGPYWNIIQYKHQGADTFTPSVFINPGNKYTLWDGNGTPKEFDLDPRTPSTISYYNSTYNGYDVAKNPRLQLRDADGKALAGEDILVRFGGTASMARFGLSDDTAGMYKATDGKPCWVIKGEGEATTPLTVPLFTRLVLLGASVAYTMDFGTPKELDIPGLYVVGAANMYTKAWQKYLADMLDRDTKVMKCRVHLDGLAPGYDLMRRFFWYDGSLWVLNKITNYSLTTWDAAECEFIQVRKPDNYTNGQTL